MSSMVKGGYVRKGWNHWLRAIFQAILIAIILTGMIIWAILLAKLLYKFNSANPALHHPANPGLFANKNQSNLSNGTTTNDGKQQLFVSQSESNVIQVFLITNICIPEGFAIIAIVAVALNDIYWCSISGTVLFVFWLLENQRYPTLYALKSDNPLDTLLVVGHCFHLIIWALLFIYGGFLAIKLRLRLKSIRQFMGRTSESYAFCLSNNIHPVGPPYYYHNSTGNMGQVPSYRSDNDVSNYDALPPPVAMPPPEFATIEIDSTGSTIEASSRARLCGSSEINTHPYFMSNMDRQLLNATIGPGDQSIRNYPTSISASHSHNGSQGKLSTFSIPSRIGSGEYGTTGVNRQMTASPATSSKTTF